MKFKLTPEDFLRANEARDKEFLPSSCPIAQCLRRILNLSGNDVEVTMAGIYLERKGSDIKVFFNTPFVNEVIIEWDKRHLPSHVNEEFELNLGFEMRGSQHIRNIESWEHVNGE